MRENDERAGEYRMEHQHGKRGFTQRIAAIAAALRFNFARSRQVQRSDNREPHKQGDHPEQASHADAVDRGDDRPEYQSNDERHTDRSTDNGHRLATFLRRCDIGGKSEDDRRNRPHSLNGAPDDHQENRIGAGGDYRAGQKTRQPGENQRFAPELVGKSAVGQLQEALGLAVEAKRHPDERLVCAGKPFRVEAEYGKDHEHAEHSRDVNCA